MQENQIQQSNKRERYELKRQQKLGEQVRAARKKTVKMISKIAVIVLLVGGSVGWLAWYIANQPKTPEGEIISQSGIHWHPQLTISAKGKTQEIPANLGLGAIHQPIHTHDSSGVLHLEIQGLVRKDDTKLGRFFKIWGKQFTSNCILDFCNNESGTVKMFVNNEENTEFENYPMKDGDKIEIRYE